MNKWCGIGRPTTDPDVRYTQGSEPLAIASLTLAVDRRFKKDGEQNADFIRCKAFGKTAETIEKYVHKGNKIAVTGRIQTGSYDDKDGKKVYTTDVVIEEMYFCESRNSSNTETTPKADADGFMEVPDGIVEDLPFM